MATKNIDIVVKAKDEASKTFDNIAQNSASFSEKVKANLTKISVVSTAITWGLVAMWKKFIDASIENEPLQKSFERLSESAWIASDEMLKAMRKASQGTVADTNLMAQANKAYALGIVKNTDDMATMIEIARLKWQAMGRTMEEALWDITTWLWRGSAQILDNLWIVVNAEEANQKYADSIGKTVKELTDEEKKQALVNAVVSQGKKELEEAGEVQLTMQEKMDRLNATWENTKNVIWDALIPVVDKLLQAVAPIIERVANWIEENPKLTSWIFMAITAIAWLTAVVSWLALALPAIWTAITVLSWPIWWIIWAITLVATAWSQNRWGIQEKTQVAVDKIKEIIWPWLDKLQARWQEHWDAIMEGVWKVLWFIADLIGTTIWWIATYIAWTFTTIEAWFKMFSALLSWDFEEVWNIATEWAQDMDEILTASFWDTRQSIKDWVSDMYNWIVDKLNSVVNAVKNIVWQIKDAWNTAKDTVSNFASNAVDKVSSFFWWWKANWWAVSAWTTYLVWERWPELFVPKSAWTIVPNETITNNNGISINMGNVQIRNDSDIQALASEIVRMTKLEKNYWII